MSEPMSGLPDDKKTINELKRELQATIRGDDAWRHPDLPDGGFDFDLGRMVDESDVGEPLKAAADYLRAAGLTPTPDAIEQLAGPFTVCLRIMCTRGYDPTGGLWRKAGVLGIIWDVRKKFERLWYRTWTLGIRHDDSGYDLINFTGMLLRSEPDSRFGDAGEPAVPRMKINPEYEMGPE